VRGLALDSRFPRKVWQFTTVPGQEEYELPSDWLIPVDVEVGGLIVNSSNPAQIAQIKRGDLTLHDAGAWYVSKDGGSLCLYPDFGTQAAEVTYVFTPQALVLGTDVPDQFPEQFHPALIHHAAANYYSNIEDDPEMAASEQEKYDADVLKLERYRIARTTGDRPFRRGGP